MGQKGSRRPYRREESNGKNKNKRQKRKIGTGGSGRSRKDGSAGYWSLPEDYPDQSPGFRALDPRQEGGSSRNYPEVQRYPRRRNGGRCSPLRFCQRRSRFR